MTSSSIILSNILASESCELKTTIDSYMDTKLKEFQEIMKSKVDSIIADKIDKFYNKSFEEHEKVLFDKDGEYAIKEYNGNQQSNFMMGGSKTYLELEKFKKENLLSTTNTKCFVIGYSKYNGSGTTSFTINIFKTFMLLGEMPHYARTHGWSKINHNLSSDCLFAIKHFQASFCAESTYDFLKSKKILEDHPEYFKKNCSDFEEICRKEYSEIEKTKLQLKALMDEQITKKDYYASLEKKIKEIELEKKQLEEDRIKLKEEKEKMVFIKEKLIQMKEEVELEKQKIEQQKNKTVDLDKCFEEIISSKKSKNKQSEKVAFD
jgi:hypothetical protein